METFKPFASVIAKSAFPSPLKSPIASESRRPDPAVYEFVLKETEEVGRPTAKYTTFEVPPPGPGLTTVTAAVRAVAMSEARIFALNFDSLTKFVARGLPFHLTTEVDTKPVPLTVSVNAVPPGGLASGRKGWLIKGTGFCAVATPVSAESAMRMLARNQQITISDTRFCNVITPLLRTAQGRLQHCRTPYLHHFPGYPRRLCQQRRPIRDRWQDRSSGKVNT